MAWDRSQEGTEISRPQVTEVTYVDSHSVRQQITLFDPRPLLLPTQWNVASAQNLRDFLTEENRIFAEYEPMYRAEAGDFITTFGNRWTGFESVEEAQLTFAADDFRNLGRKVEGAIAPLDSLLEVKVLDPASGETLFFRSYTNSAARELAEGWPDWRPARFLASVESSFLSTRMNVLESSGFEEVDRRLEVLLASQLIGKGMLKDGPYIVEVGP